MEEKVHKPFKYLAEMPGKSLRTKLIDTFNEWFEVPEQTKNSIASAIEILHTASLLIDDIEDSAPMRRGKECAHIKFGVPLTINSANLAYFEALRELQSISASSEIATIFADEMINLHMGQGLEIYYRDEGIRPSLEDYFEICKLKTGGLLRMTMRLLISMSKKKFEEEIESLMNGVAQSIGLFYQIRNDYLNLFHEDASDLVEGKFTLPTLYAEIDSIKCVNEEQKMSVLDKIKEKNAENRCIERLSEIAAGVCFSIDFIESKIQRNSKLNEIIISLLIKS